MNEPYPSTQDLSRIEQPIWIQVLRWIAILPGAIIGAGIVNIISGIVMWLGSSRFGDETWFDLIWRQLITNGAYGAAFVFCAAWIAPKGKIPIAITFSAIVLFISGVACVPTIAEKDWLSLVGLVAMNVGSIVISVGITRGEIDA